MNRKSFRAIEREIGQPNLVALIRQQSQDHAEQALINRQTAAGHYKRRAALSQQQLDAARTVGLPDPAAEA